MPAWSWAWRAAPGWVDAELGGGLDRLRSAQPSNTAFSPTASARLAAQGLSGTGWSMPLNWSLGRRRKSRQAPDQHQGHGDQPPLPTQSSSDKVSP